MRRYVLVTPPMSQACPTRGHASGVSGITTANFRFTSKVGHRYFLRVTKKGCDGVAYSVSFVPTDALGTRLEPTVACTHSRRAATKHRSALRRLEALRRLARRRSLQRKIELRPQQVATADADAKTACIRKPLSGYPWLETATPGRAELSTIERRAWRFASQHDRSTGMTFSSVSNRFICTCPVGDGQAVPRVARTPALTA